MLRSTEDGTSGDEEASPRSAFARPKKSKSKFTTTTSCPSPTSSFSLDFEFMVSQHLLPLSADLHLLHPFNSTSSSRPSSVTKEEAPSHHSLPFSLPPKPQRSTKYLSSLANHFSSEKKIFFYPATSHIINAMSRAKIFSFEFFLNIVPSF